MAARACVLWLLGGLALGSAGARAADAPKPQPKASAPAEKSADAPLDEDLLEFLGSIDAGDEDWMDYLTETDIETVSQTRPTRAASEVKKDE